MQPEHQWIVNHCVGNTFCIICRRQRRAFPLEFTLLSRFIREIIVCLVRFMLKWVSFTFVMSLCVRWPHVHQVDSWPKCSRDLIVVWVIHVFLVRRSCPCLRRLFGRLPWLWIIDGRWRVLWCFTFKDFVESFEFISHFFCPRPKWPHLRSKYQDAWR